MVVGRSATVVVCFEVTSSTDGNSRVKCGQNTRIELFSCDQLITFLVHDMCEVVKYYEAQSARMKKLLDE